MKLNSKCCNCVKSKFSYKFLKYSSNNFSQKALSIHHNFSYKLIISSISKQNNLCHIPKKNFTDDSNKSQTSDQRYFHEFESPQAQTITVKTFGFKIAKFLLIISTMIIVIYKFLLHKYNVLSKNYKWYIINNYYDIKLSQSASDKLKNILEHYIYKKDCEETQLVFKIYKNLAEKNHFPFIPNINNIYVVHFVSIGACLFKNGDLFISDRIIELANNNEDQIAFFISAEMASCLMDNVTKRILYYYLLKNYGKYLPVEAKNAKITSFSFVGYKRDNLNFFNYFLHFYPENVISTYYEEYEIMRVAFKLMNKAEYNLDEVNIIKFYYYLIEY